MELPHSDANRRFQAKRLRKADPNGSSERLYAEHEKQDWSISGVIHRTIYRPFQMLALEPILVLVTIYLSLVYGLIYARTFLPLIIYSNCGLLAV